MEIPLAGETAAVTVDQMREVDRIMIEDLGIELLQMMENAGRNLADIAIRRFQPRSATVLAGTGGNGGGGMAAARHLANRGVDTTVVVVRTDLDGAPETQRQILEDMGVLIGLVPTEPGELVIDALIGYSLAGDPRGRAAELIEWANASGTPVLALDTPSGLDVTTGEPGRPVISATATMTLAAPKTGLFGSPHVGELYLADISVPPLVYLAIGVDFVSPFAAGTIVRIR